MRDFFLQIVLLLIGAVLGMIAPLLPTDRARKWLVGALSISFVAVSLIWIGYEIGTGNSANGDPSPQPSQEILVEEEDKVLVYYSSYMNTNERQVDEFMTQLFRERNPDISIKHSTVENDGFTSAIQPLLVSEMSPDVIAFSPGYQIRSFIDQGLVLDIASLWEKEHWDENYVKNFRSVAIPDADDKVYFLPRNWYWFGIFYRKSTFEKNNIKPPETWDELLNACDTLNQAGVVPITIGTKDGWAAAAWFDYINMRLNGPQFHLDLMRGQEAYDDHRVKSVFKKWVELFDHNCFIENPTTYDWYEAIVPLDQGEAGMYLLGPFITDFLSDEATDDIDFFRFPIIDPSVSIGEDVPSDYGYFIPANAKNVEEAQEFLAFTGSAEAQKIITDELGRFPANKKANTNLGLITQKGVELVEEADMILQFYDRDTDPEMAANGINAMIDFWDDPNKIDDILDNLESKRREIFLK